MNGNEPEDWNSDDATWRLLGESAPVEPGNHFVDDTVRAVKLLPDAQPWLPRLFWISPWAAVAACGAIAAFFLMNGPEAVKKGGSVVSVVESGEKWVEIEEVADAEMLAAAADDFDSFSDHELVTLIGF